ncbi:MAG: hypothetical protein M0Z49_12470 [Chloroflexi bacterium]|nr:hypothetical protein [Chloroflexota bacterium]
MIRVSWPRILRPVTRAVRWHRRQPNTIVTVVDIRPNQQRARRYEIVLGRRQG